MSPGPKVLGQICALGGVFLKLCLKKKGAIIPNYKTPKGFFTRVVEIKNKYSIGKTFLFRL